MLYKHRIVRIDKSYVLQKKFFGLWINKIYFPSHRDAINEFRKLEGIE